MFFTSTRSTCSIESASAIAKGLADDGGLFVPESFPVFSESDIAEMLDMDYQGRAVKVLSRYLTDFSAEEITQCVKAAYSGKFDNDEPAPLVEVARGMNLLELWHGPTCAFKDMALQLLPHLLTASVAKVSSGRTTVILVATSGDTGKAALDGFADVDGTKIIVFYPQNGVSDMQKLQMTTQQGKNVAVCAINGNFDNAQSGVKNIFADKAMAAKLDAHAMDFSSANSINFGRLVPQIVYYVSSYCDLVKSGRIKLGDSFNVVVPTGNFGNILAAYYAKQMGIPIKKFICASNKNNILTDFINTGVYDRNREFYTTTSPSMDILISSNLERLLYLLAGKDCKEVAKLMQQLKDEGKYSVSGEMLAALQKEFYGGSADDSEAAEAIKELYEKYNYLCDTHTAVAVKVYQKYLAETGDDACCVIASTASPYKFAPAVLEAVIGNEVCGNGFEIVEKLSKTTGTAVPAPLAGLAEKEVLHKSCVEKDEMADFITSFLGV